MTDSVARGPGRLSIYSEEIASEVLERLANGESLNAICKDDHLPVRSVIYKWVVDDREGFADRYARARDVQLHGMADDLAEISDAGVMDMVDVQKNRLRVDTRKWLLSKLMPKTYGDKTQMEHTGSEGGPIDIVTTRRIVKSAEDKEQP